MVYTIGVISDTHGLLRPSVHEAFKGVDLILHAGDVGGRVSTQDILLELRTIAPVHAVYGNCDAPGEADLTTDYIANIEGYSFHVQHGHELGRPSPERLAEAYPHDVVIFGHTHIPVIEWMEGRLILNPGAAGPKRFDIEPTVARIEIDSTSSEGKKLSVEHILL